MFINLTNHPSTKFPEAQKKAAGEFGEIHDIAFPEISPYSSDQEVQKIVDIYFDKATTLLAMSNDMNNVIHVMGEMCFVHKFVTDAWHANIRCVASTTERRVVEKENGEKISIFNFVQFREY